MLLNVDGILKKDVFGNDIIYFNYVVIVGFNELFGGIEVDFLGIDFYIVGNEFFI